MTTNIASAGMRRPRGRASDDGADRTAAGFHAGELAVQRRAGVQAEAARLAPMLEPAELRGGLAAFLGDRTFAVLTARDQAGRLWTSPLSGPPGILAVTSPTTLRVTAAIPAADPLHGLPAGQPVGMIAIEFATRRRVRLNGTLTEAEAANLAIDVEQAFGNCPRYIQPRVVSSGSIGQHGHQAASRQATTLAAADASLIRSADTFFLGTTHPERGADVSHRGGRPGFVRVEGDRLWWPDYPGNNMFTSFGNLAVNPEAALLFADFGTGATLHLSGTASVEWGQAGAPGDDGRTGRRVRFDPQRLVANRLLNGDTRTRTLLTGQAGTGRFRQCRAAGAVTLPTAGCRRFSRAAPSLLCRKRMPLCRRSRSGLTAHCPRSRRRHFR